jgi:phenylacetate-coenzyme A ligase PaaK-like adenylate-forming protein
VAGRFSLASPGAREVAGFVRSIVQSVRVERAGRDAVAQLRRQRTRAVLEAAANTRLYGPQLTPAAVREGRLDAVLPVSKSEYLSRVEETVTANDVTREQLERFVRDPRRAGELLDGRYIVAMTSGTTGQVGIFVNDVDSWALTRGVTFARIFRDRFTPSDILRVVGRRRYRMAFVVAAGGHFMTYLLARRVPPAGALVLDARVYSIEMPLPAMARELNALQPLLLHSYPTLIELLAHEKRRGRLDIAPEIITCGSETLSQGCRDAVREAFPDATLVETYAATECVPLATACRYGHLHINEDACHLEAVDDDGRPVAPGERGDRLLVTNLLNTAQPLLRYELTDQAEIDVRPCDCGSPFARVRVFGRTDDTFFLRDPSGAWQAHPPIPLEIVFLQVPGLLQYQLVHERQNELRVLFVAEDGVAGQQVAGVIDAQLSRYLGDHGLLPSVSYTIEEVEGIERPASSRKIRQIKSQVPRPQAAVQDAPNVRERRRRPRKE